MPYCHALQLQRKCNRIKKDGQPCQAYAVWGGDLCVFHGGKPLPGEYGENRRPMCECGTDGSGGGYKFPHRIGGGKYCVYSLNWVRPTRTIGPSEPQLPRATAGEKQLIRILSRER